MWVRVSTMTKAEIDLSKETRIFKETVEVVTKQLLNPYFCLCGESHSVTLDKNVLDGEIGETTINQLYDIGMAYIRVVRLEGVSSYTQGEWPPSNHIHLGLITLHLIRLDFCLFLSLDLTANRRMLLETRPHLISLIDILCRKQTIDFDRSQDRQNFYARLASYTRVGSKMSCYLVSTNCISLLL